MKRLIVFVLTLLAMSAAYGASTHYCPDFSNDWTATNEGTGHGQYTIHAIQASNGTGGFLLEGAVNGFWCQADGTTKNYTIDNTKSKPMGNGQFYIVANASPPTQCAYIATWDITLGTVGCATAVIGAPGGIYPSPINAQYCLLPNTNNGATGSAGETYNTSVWDASGAFAIYSLQAKTPSLDSTALTTYNWAGRRISESFSGTTGDPVQTVPPVIFAPWPPNYTDGYPYTDDIGYGCTLGQCWFDDGRGVAGTQRINARGGYPRGGQATQHLTMDCPAGEKEFETHNVSIQVTSDTQIQILRNGQGPDPNPHDFGYTPKQFDRFFLRYFIYSVGSPSILYL